MPNEKTKQELRECPLCDGTGQCLDDDYLHQCPDCSGLGLCPTVCDSCTEYVMPAAGMTCDACFAEEQEEERNPLLVQIGEAVRVIGSIAEGSAVWCALRDEEDLGASESPAVVIRRGAEVVARVSYNGRAWGLDGSEITLPKSVTK